MHKLIYSLYFKLALSLLLSFALVAMLLMALVQNMTRNYQDEVEQKLHLQLAEHIVYDNQLFRDRQIDKQALAHAFHNLMILGPSFEFYVLSPQGDILTYSADPAKIKRQKVDLVPVQDFIQRRGALPIWGDDPRSQQRSKIFSAAEIRSDGELLGYLYVIIGGEIYDGIADLISDSHIVKLSVWGLVAGLLLCLAIGLTLFALVTRPMRRLDADMQKFRALGFQLDQISLSHWQDNSADEIQRLGSTFTAMADELKQQYEKVKTTDQLRRELISYVSHDLRTPLAALQGYLETWQLKQRDIDPEEGAQLIAVADENARQIGKLVEQLFELAHLDSDNVQLQREPVAVAELAQDILMKRSLEAQAQGIRLDVNPKDPSLMVEADIEKLERVFTNLVDNAIRHTDSGGTVEIVFRTQDQGLEVQVRDDGVGIPDEEQEQVFDPHYRASNSVRGRRVNSGLGLAITKRILELHGSQIHVDSQLNAGACFSFTMPLASFN